MPYVEDENGNHILDSDGNKIAFSVSYDTSNEPPYVHREPIHINDSGHVDTENRNLVIKDGIDSNHAVSKGQLDSIDTTMRSDMNTLIQSSIQTSNTQMTSLIQTSIQTLKSQIIELIQPSIQIALNKFKSDLQKSVIEFRNNE